MKKLGGLFLIVGLAALGIGIYGFIKLGSDAELFDLINSAVKEFGGKITGFDAFAMGNRIWLTIAGGVATLAGGAMVLKKN